MLRSKTFLWYLYDFANSFATIVLLFYFPLILSEKGVSDTWIGVSTSIATGILLFCLPYLGLWSDKTRKRVFIVKACSWIMFLSLVLLAIFCQFFNITETTILLVAFFLYILFQVTWQGSYAFYSAQLKELATEDTNTSVSGRGMGFGQLGNVIALALVFPIIGSSISIFGISGKPLALVIGAFLFVIFAYAYLSQKELSLPVNIIKFSYKEYLHKIFSQKKIFYYLIGYALLADGILTFQIYLTIYMKKVFMLSDALVTYVGIVGLLFCIVGGLIAHKTVRIIKSKEGALVFSSVAYAIAFILFCFAPVSPILPFIIMIPSGIAYGLSFTISRVIYSDMTPKDEQAEYFGIYTIFERSASIIGPLLWILSFKVMISHGEDIQYRGAVLMLAVICFVGVFFLRKSFGIKIPLTANS